MCLDENMIGFFVCNSPGHISILMVKLKDSLLIYLIG